MNHVNAGAASSLSAQHRREAVLPGAYQNWYVAASSSVSSRNRHIASSPHRKKGRNRIRISEISLVAPSKSPVTPPTRFLQYKPKSHIVTHAMAR
jgi:hypothetical protein